MNRALNLPLTLALLLVASAAQAQNNTVWRCGADGRSYTDSPCPGGQMLQVADPRSAADRAEGRDVALREQRLARQMVQERREREQALRGSGLAGIKPAEVAVKPQPEARWSPRPQAKRKLASAAGTSRAAARGSRRAQG